MSASEVIFTEFDATSTASILDNVVTVDESEVIIGVASQSQSVAVDVDEYLVLVDSATVAISVTDVVDEIVIDSEYDTCANPAPSPKALFAIAGENLDVGMPLYMDSQGVLFKASATGIAANVIGLATYVASDGGLCSYTTDGQVQRSDWTFIAGTPRLSVGKMYFLSALPGKITDIPPNTGVAVPVGTAVYDTTLDVEIGQSIQLL